MTVDLSVLVCGIHTRRNTFIPQIAAQLFDQWEALDVRRQAKVEVLTLTDTKSLTIGAKRSALAQAATGRYVQFVDDDDRIEPDMLRTVQQATVTNVDVITFLASVRLNGGPVKLCRYSKNWGRDYNTPDEYRRLPNHICAVKRDLALTAGWGDINYGEDSDYSARLLPLLRTEGAIDRVLYHYDYSEDTSESRR